MGIFDIRVMECINGEHKGKSFSFHSHGAKGHYSCQEVVNGKINRYPYFHIAIEDLHETGVSLPSGYNTQIEVDYKYMNVDKLKECGYEPITQEQINQGLVIAYRIIKHSERREQFEIRVSAEFTDKKKHFCIEVMDTRNKLFNIEIAKITFLDGDFYIIHRDIHYDGHKGLSGGYRMKVITDKMRETFDHKWLGVKYKKFIDLTELDSMKVRNDKQ